MKIVGSFLLVIFVVGIGCDPVRRIDMKSNARDTVHFIWTLNEDSLMNNPFLLSNSKELKFTITPSMNKPIRMSFGAGSWTPKEVHKLVGFLQSLEVVSSSKRLRIDSLPLLRDYLLARRKGIGGARIEIAFAD